MCNENLWKYSPINKNARCSPVPLPARAPNPPAEPDWKCNIYFQPSLRVTLQMPELCTIQPIEEKLLSCACEDLTLKCTVGFLCLSLSPPCPHPPDHLKNSPLVLFPDVSAFHSTFVCVCVVLVYYVLPSKAKNLSHVLAAQSSGRFFFSHALFLATHPPILATHYHMSLSRLRASKGRLRSI